MADSAARIAEIRQALSSTGKSVSDYSARFAAGEAPEQVDARAAGQSAAEGALREDEVFQVLQELSKLSKARVAACRRGRARSARLVACAPANCGTCAARECGLTPTRCARTGLARPQRGAQRGRRDTHPERGAPARRAVQRCLLVR